MRIVWPGAERRREPLLDRDGDRAGDQYRAGGVLDRVMRGQVRRDRFEVGGRQLDHRRDPVLPSVFRVAPRIGDQVEAVAARAGGLHLLTAGALRQLNRRRAALTTARRTLPSCRGLLSDCRGRERRQEHDQSEREERSRSHTASRSNPPFPWILRPTGLTRETDPGGGAGAIPAGR